MTVEANAFTLTSKYIHYTYIMASSTFCLNDSMLVAIAVLVFSLRQANTKFSHKCYKTLHHLLKCFHCQHFITNANTLGCKLAPMNALACSKSTPPKLHLSLHFSVNVRHQRKSRVSD